MNVLLAKVSKEDGSLKENHLQKLEVLLEGNHGYFELLKILKD